MQVIGVNQQGQTILWGEVYTREWIHGNRSHWASNRNCLLHILKCLWEEGGCQKSVNLSQCNLFVVADWFLAVAKHLLIWNQVRSYDFTPYKGVATKSFISSHSSEQSQDNLSTHIFLIRPLPCILGRNLLVGLWLIGDYKTLEGCPTLDNFTSNYLPPSPVTQLHSCRICFLIQDQPNPFSLFLLRNPLGILTGVKTLLQSHLSQITAAMQKTIV